MGTEKLKFKLELYATMWDKSPHAEIMVDNQTYFKKNITGSQDKPNVIEFEHECEEDKLYQLVIKRSNKRNGQTVVNEKGDILKDQLLNIKTISIDDIDLGSLIYEGVYTPNYPEPWATQQKKQGHELKSSFTNVTQMGHNGTCTFGFTSPFYMWLLHNLY